MVVHQQLDQVYRPLTCHIDSNNEVNTTYVKHQQKLPPLEKNEASSSHDF